MNVLTAAWMGSGSPQPDNLGRRGACARCGSEAELVPVGTAISKTFTGFDGWRDVTGRGLCPPCAWGHSTATLRSNPHIVRRDPPCLAAQTRSQVAETLLAGGLPVDVAVVVPLRPGRKHILPTASWGRVNVDDTQLAWTSRESHLLTDVVDLRGAGFGSQMLREATPPFGALSKLPRHQWAAVLDAWGRLAVWRSPDNPWLALALNVTTLLEA